MTGTRLGTVVFAAVLLVGLGLWVARSRTGAPRFGAPQPGVPEAPLAAPDGMVPAPPPAPSLQRADAAVETDRESVLQVLEPAGASVPLLHGRLLAAENGAPLSNGRVRVLREVEVLGQEPLETGEDGTFVLPLDDVELPALGLAACQGRGQRVFEIAAATTEDAPLEVRLVRSAALVARVLDARGAALDGVEVHLIARPRDLVDLPGPTAALARTALGRSALTDGRGEARLEDLPAGAPLHATLLSGERELLRPVEDIVLRPGEEAERTWTVGLGTTVHGVLVDEGGAPVPDAEVWRVAGAAPRRVLDEGQRSRVLQRATTDAAGAFVMPDVPAGTWWLGPAPLEGLAGEVVRVPVDLSRAALDVRLVVHRGLYLRGTVLDAAGRPAERAGIDAMIPDSLIQAHGEAHEGRFEVGPLVPGSYEVTAGGFGQRSSEPLLVEAGREDLVLRLRESGVLRCRAVDAVTGEPVTAAVRAEPLRTDHARTALGGVGPARREHVFRALDPDADHALLGRSADGRVGRLVRRPEPEGGAEVWHELALQPGGTLVLTVAAEARGGFCILWWGDAVYHAGGLLPGSRLELPVPDEELVLAWTPRGSSGAVETHVLCPRGARLERELE